MISVIVPVYNVENVLHYCIDSILNQTYKDFELILVDDGSTDKSGNICDEYADKESRIRVFHKENGGVSSARNFGIDNANGDYICFIDSDDYVNGDYLELLMHTKSKYPESDNIWCCFTTINSYGGNPQNRNCIKSDKDCVEFDRSQIMTLHEKWLDAGPVCKLYSKEVIVKNRIRFNESISLGEDLIFNFDYIVRWGCDDEQKQKFYNSCFYLYERVLTNTYHKDSDCKHKVRYNTRILKSEEFTKSLYHSNCFIHPAYRFAYKHQSYFLVRALDIILKIKKAK